ncbi:MAG TPA: gamma-butyrobetaine hydroxylase-like domain-containing protein [Roseiarcus sp.]|nr:gamma-butyrobetaine hydroxylase-like domain-containing protein [Roseiarcus sp.]
MSEEGKSSASAPWPTELRVREGGRALRIAFDDGFAASIPAERLRAASPSADKRRAPSPAGGAVTIVGVETVGNYAARIAFSDGHDTGIYSWALLRRLAADEATPPAS